MTKVYCSFKECNYISQWDNTEELGICSKDEITLDKYVEDIMFGCPDAKWDNNIFENEDD